MNSLGTHDTPRILTLLGAGGTCSDKSKQWRAEHRLTPNQLRRGKDRLKAAALLLFAFPGSPTIYYGDEAGMEGWEDPFNRRTYPWGGEDTDLRSFVASLGAARKAHRALRRGDISYVAANGPLLAFTRSAEGKTILIAANNSNRAATFSFPAKRLVPLLDSTATLRSAANTVSVTLSPLSGGMWLTEED